MQVLAGLGGTTGDGECVMVVWLIGMAESGKSTIGKKLAQTLRKTTPALVYLDGDVLRQVWGDHLGHEINERRINAHRISHLCKMLDEQGISVVACVLSIFHEWQSWNRSNFSRYFEIFIDVPFETLVKRDSKGLYKKALRGELDNVVGVDIHFPRPVRPDFVLRPPEALAEPEKIVEMIVEAIGANSHK